MNIVIIPFHDWRKIQTEGSRTRDAHLIEQFELNDNIDNVVIVNRPTSILEILLKRQKIRIEGEVLLSINGMSLTKVKESVYVIDFISNNYIGLILNKFKWFFSEFENKKFVAFYFKALELLELEKYHFLTHNVFSAKFCKVAVKDKYIFDAYDNLVLFPGYSKIKKEIASLYSIFDNDSNCLWITNSKTNREYYQRHYNQNNVAILPNGVNVDMLSKKYTIPTDLMNLPKPWVGFGGKITHLIDKNLYNYIVEANKDYSFILVGQILDKNLFKSISNHPNVYYLGDKSYNDYIHYSTNFDIAIIPYVTGKKDTGANTIKAYEFIAANIPLIGTIGNGLQDLEKYVYLADDKEMFSSLIKEVNTPKSMEVLSKTYSWEYICSNIVNIFKSF